MATVSSIGISGPHAPVVSTYDPTFSPASLHLAPYHGPDVVCPESFTVPPSSSSQSVPMGSRYEKVPHEGPGTAIYVRQPTRAQLRENNGVFGSAQRPFFYKDPESKPFIDIDGKVCGDRWIYVDPLDGEPRSSTKCCIM
ncbi:hypothetical protein JCM21900_005284 [Sporobolomyces salmonicolor]